MSTDEELRQAERDGNYERVRAIRERMGDNATQLLMLEFAAESDRLKNTNVDLVRTIKANEKRILFLEKVTSAITGNPCDGCRGQGRVRIWHAQDESEVINCSTCNGTGFAKERVR